MAKVVKLGIRCVKRPSPIQCPFGKLTLPLSQISHVIASSLGALQSAIDEICKKSFKDSSGRLTRVFFSKAHKKPPRIAHEMKPCLYPITNQIEWKITTTTFIFEVSPVLWGTAKRFWKMERGHGMGRHSFIQLIHSRRGSGCLTNQYDCRSSNLRCTTIWSWNG